MSEIYQEVFELLGVGMATVFLILASVVLIGQGLVRLINRFYPAKIPAPSATSAIPDQHIAAITAAVEVLSEGNARIHSIRPEQP